MIGCRSSSCLLDGAPVSAADAAAALGRGSPMNATKRRQNPRISNDVVKIVCAFCVVPDSGCT